MCGFAFECRSLESQAIKSVLYLFNSFLPECAMEAQRYKSRMRNGKGYPPKKHMRLPRSIVRVDLKISDHIINFNYHMEGIEIRSFL